MLLNSQRSQERKTKWWVNFAEVYVPKMDAAGTCILAIYNFWQFGAFTMPLLGSARQHGRNTKDKSEIKTQSLYQQAKKQHWWSLTQCPRFGNHHQIEAVAERNIKSSSRGNAQKQAETGFHCSYTIWKHKLYVLPSLLIVRGMLWTVWSFTQEFVSIWSSTDVSEKLLKPATEIQRKSN